MTIKSEKSGRRPFYERLVNIANARPMAATEKTSPVKPFPAGVGFAVEVGCPGNAVGVPLPGVPDGSGVAEGTRTGSCEAGVIYRSAMASLFGKGFFQ